MYKAICAHLNRIIGKCCAKHSVALLVGEKHVSFSVSSIYKKWKTWGLSYMRVNRASGGCYNVVHGVHNVTDQADGAGGSRLFEWKGR